MPAYLNSIAARPLVAAVDAAALRTLESDQIVTGQNAIILTGALARKLFVFASSSVDGDNGTTVIRPNDIAGGSPGRWLILSDSASTPNTTALRDANQNVFLAGLNGRLALNDAAAFNARVNVSVTSFLFDHTPKAPGGGVGANWRIEAQQGAPGSKGGDIMIAVGKGGVPGTDQPGFLKLEVGEPDSLGLTGTVRITSNDAPWMQWGVDTDSVYEHVQAIGGFTISNTHGIRAWAGTDMVLVTGDNQPLVITDEVDIGGNPIPVVSLYARRDGIYEHRVSGEPTEVYFYQQQRASGDGATWSFEAQRGASGQAGGSIFLRVGRAGTPGTGTAGNIVLELGQPDASLFSGQFAMMANGVEFQRTTLSADVAVTLVQATNGYRLSSIAGVTIGAVTGQAFVVGSDQTLTFTDDSTSAAFVMTPDRDGNALIESFGSTTGVGYGAQQLAGTGAKAGTQAVFYAGRGQAVGGGTNNNGGQVALRSGGRGTGGSGGAHGNIVLGMHTEDTITITHDSTSARSLRWEQSITAPTIDQVATGGTSVTASTLTVRAQVATGTTSTGGLLALEGGSGTAAGGNVSLQGGSGTAGNAPGGNIEMKGGARSGTGAQGNIAFHITGPNYEGGARITAWSQAEVAPSAAPDSGLMFLWVESEQLKTAEASGHIDELTYTDENTSPTVSKGVRRRMGVLDTTSSSPVYPVVIPSSGLPAGNFVGVVRAHVIAYDSTDNSIFEGMRKAAVKRTSGTTTVVTSAANQILGVDETGSAASADIRVESDGANGIRVRYASGKGTNVHHVSVWLEFFASEHA